MNRELAKRAKPGNFGKWLRGKACSYWVLSIGERGLADLWRDPPATHAYYLRWLMVRWSPFTRRIMNEIDFGPSGHGLPENMLKAKATVLRVGKRLASENRTRKTKKR